MPRQKRRNPVVQKNIHRNQLISQSVKVVVTAPKARPRRKSVVTHKISDREKHLIEREQAASQQQSLALRLPSPAAGHSLFSVLHARESDKLDEVKRGILAHLSTLKGGSPTPAVQGNGITDSLTEPAGGGLAQFMYQGTPPRTPVDSPVRTVTSNEPSSQQKLQTTVSRIYTDAERLRSWLIANIQYVPAGKSYDTFEKQLERLQRIHDIQTLIKLRVQTQEELRRQGMSPQLPINTTPKDYEQFDRTGLVGRRLNFDLPGIFGKPRKLLPDDRSDEGGGGLDWLGGAAPSKSS